MARNRTHTVAPCPRHTTRYQVPITRCMCLLGPRPQTAMRKRRHYGEVWTQQQDANVLVAVAAAGVPIAIHALYLMCALLEGRLEAVSSVASAAPPIIAMVSYPCVWAPQRCGSMSCRVCLAVQPSKRPHRKQRGSHDIGQQQRPSHTT